MEGERLNTVNTDAVGMNPRDTTNHNQQDDHDQEDHRKEWNWHHLAKHELLRWLLSVAGILLGRWRMWVGLEGVPSRSGGLIFIFFSANSIFICMSRMPM